jgi:hypothetical protein
LPLAVIGSQVAHSVDYRIVAPDPGERAHLLAETGHRYLAYLPLVLALCTVVVALGLVAEAGHRGGSTGRALRAWHFGLVAPAVFACQELFERLAHDGSLPWNAVFEPTFVVGLAVQVPFALLAFGLARWLLRAAAAVGRVLGGAPRHRSWPGSAVVPAPTCRVDAPRLPVLALGFGTRGPPLRSS